MSREAICRLSRDRLKGRFREGYRVGEQIGMSRDAGKIGSLDGSGVR
jgi:hypothetical protein